MSRLVWLLAVLALLVGIYFLSRGPSVADTQQTADTPGEEPVMVLIDDDVAGTIARLKAAGVTIVTEPGEAPWEPGRTVAEFRDSEGNRMVLGSG